MDLLKTGVSLVNRTDNRSWRSKKFNYRRQLALLVEDLLRLRLGELCTLIPERHLMYAPSGEDAKLVGQFDAIVSDGALQPRLVIRIKHRVPEKLGKSSAQGRLRRALFILQKRWPEARGATIIVRFLYPRQANFPQAHPNAVTKALKAVLTRPSEAVGIHRIDISMESLWRYSLRRGWITEDDVSFVVDRAFEHSRRVKSSAEFMVDTHFVRTRNWNLSPTDYSLKPMM